MLIFLFLAAELWTYLADMKRQASERLEYIAGQVNKASVPMA